MDLNRKRFAVVRKFFKKYKRLPSLSEGMSLFHVSSKTVTARLYEFMIEEGYLYKKNRKFMPTSKFFEIPLLGSVKAGMPTVADSFVDHISIDDYIVKDPVATFTFKVRTDCLKDMGINIGDLAVIERTKEAKLNDIVLVVVNNDWCLRILHEKEGKKVLDVANPDASPIYLEGPPTVYGVVRGIVKRFGSQ